MFYKCRELMLFFWCFMCPFHFFSRCYVVWSVYISLSLRLVCYKSWWRATQWPETSIFLSINCIPCKKRTFLPWFSRGKILINVPYQGRPWFVLDCYLASGYVSLHYMYLLCRALFLLLCLSSACIFRFDFGMLLPSLSLLGVVSRPNLFRL